jgi:hypothetical protein
MKPKPVMAGGTTVIGTITIRIMVATTVRDSRTITVTVIRTTVTMATGVATTAISITATTIATTTTIITADCTSRLASKSVGEMPYRIRAGGSACAQRGGSCRLAFGVVD